MNKKQMRNNLENALDMMKEKTENIKGKAPGQLVELIKTITRWEEMAHNNGENDIWYKLQTLNHEVESELLKNIK